MVRIQASRCTFMAIVNDTRLTSLPSDASVCSNHASRKKASAARSAVDRWKESPMPPFTTGKAVSSMLQCMPPRSELRFWDNDMH
ncbi:hypothetical protein NKI15_15385 [Mesorhizobium sp. M0862]|uniref:hypothetical protein n=1 Tax=Mesorhizobium sp. M0862 TaxID=2957015 RepID=UPI00333D1B25